MSEEKVLWMVNSDPEVGYDKVAYYRCPDIQEFVEKIGVDNIVGVIVDDNNIGFITKD